MDTAGSVELDPDRQAIVLALLTHPRLTNLKAQFLDDMNHVLSNRHAIERLAAAVHVDADDLSSRGRRLSTRLSHEGPIDQVALRECAGVVCAFCLSAGLLSFWGHFTATLSKLATDDVFIDDVAARCDHRSAQEVRAAIRDFGDVRRMPAGAAGM